MKSFRPSGVLVLPKGNTQMADEVWKCIPDYPGYEASSEGRVRNHRRGLVLVGTVTQKGYRQFNLRGARGRRVAFGHRLVAAAFLGPPPSPPGHLVNHLDTDKLNNTPGNLEYTTPQGNARHAAAHGLMRPGRLLGERNPNAKLTADRVRALREAHHQGVSFAELGRRYGITATAARRVVLRKDWKHVP